MQIIQQIHTHKKDVSKDKEVFKCTTVANASDYRGGERSEKTLQTPPKKFKIKKLKLSKNSQALRLNQKISQEPWLVGGSFTNLNPLQITKSGISLVETQAMIRPCFKLIGCFLLPLFSWLQTRSLVPLPTLGAPISVITGFVSSQLLFSSSSDKGEGRYEGGWEEEE